MMKIGSCDGEKKKITTGFERERSLRIVKAVMMVMKVLPTRKKMDKNDVECYW